VIKENCPFSSRRRTYGGTNAIASDPG